MMGFISPRAIVKGWIEEEATVLGPTIIEERTLIGKNVIIGYPAEKTLRSLTSSLPSNIKEHDRASKGAVVGTDCIIRSGTVIYEDVTIGNQVRTGHYVLIREGSAIGADTLIGSSAKLDGAVHVGRRVKIQSNAYLPHLTLIGDDVFIGPNVCFTNDPYPPSRHMSGIIVGENSIICANATLIAGVKVGRNSVVGAGAVVTKDVSANSVVLGNPAHFYMTSSEYQEKRNAWEKESLSESKRN